jgi:hypothetical protein
MNDGSVLFYGGSMGTPHRQGKGICWLQQTAGCPDRRFALGARPSAASVCFSPTAPSRRASRYTGHRVMGVEVPPRYLELPTRRSPPRSPPVGKSRLATCSAASAWRVPLTWLRQRCPFASLGYSPFPASRHRRDSQRPSRCHKKRSRGKEHTIAAPTPAARDDMNPIHSW